VKEEQYMYLQRYYLVVVPLLRIQRTFIFQDLEEKFHEYIYSGETEPSTTSRETSLSPETVDSFDKLDCVSSCKGGELELVLF